ncbi:hypothetical protein J3U46_00460, partial [Gilliamella sp. B3771]
LAIAAGGGDTGAAGAAIAAGKNAVENNAVSLAEGGTMNGFIGIHHDTAAQYDSILHASANNYLTAEETEQALSGLIKGKGMPNGSDYAELWMRAPEQIGQYLPGPIGIAMEILALADVAITNTDKANLVQLLTEASKDHLSGLDNSESMAALDMMISRLAAGSKNKQLQGIIKRNVESNVAKNQKGNASSKFGDHVAKEQEINANSGKRPEDKIWTETSKKESVTNAYDHWDKHKHEFPEFQNSKQYVDATHNFVRNPPEGTLTKVRKNGDTVFYNPQSNIFAVKNADGTPKTMFKPNPADHGYKTNLEYFNAQK